MKRLVDADALIKRLKDMGLSYRADILNTIDVMAQNELQGHWEDKSTYTKEWQTAKCSVCGNYHTTPYAYFFEEYGYCPNCGATMRREDDDE